jgi:hypothetical protein
VVRKKLPEQVDIALRPSALDGFPLCHRVTPFVFSYVRSMSLGSPILTSDASVIKKLSLFLLQNANVPLHR